MINNNTMRNNIVGNGLVGCGGPADSKEWEWAKFSESDLARVVTLGAYMNAACYHVYEARGPNIILYYIRY